MPVIDPKPLCGDSHYFVKCDKCGDAFTSVTDRNNVPDAVDCAGGWYEYDILTDAEVILCRECGK